MVAPQAPPAVGGVERHVAELCRELVGRGVAVTLAVCDPSGSATVVPGGSETTELEGVRVRRFPAIGGDNGLHLSPWLARWAWRNAAAFDVVHGHSYHAPVALAAFLAAKRAGRPFILTSHYHGGGHSPIRRALHVPYRTFGAAMVRRADAVICVSEAEAALVRRSFGPGVPVEVIPNGIDVQAIRAAEPVPSTDERRLVLVAGRLEAYKRVDRVIDAMAELRETHRLVVAGDGPERSRLAGRAAARGLSNSVAFLGAVERGELLRWLRSADTVVTLSEHEAFGLVVLEAVAAGAAVVASAIPAHLELESRASDRITTVATDATSPSIAAAIGAGARAEPAMTDVARIPTWPDVAEQTLRVYERAIKGHAEHARATRRRTA